VGSDQYKIFLISFAAVKESGKFTTLTKLGAARNMVCMLLIVFSQYHSFATHTNITVKKPEGKSFPKEYSIKNGALPSSTKVEVINQELPWIEEIHFKMERTEKPVVDFSCLVRKLFLDLFRVITPSNAP
jgi:hypothetical protein